MNSRIVLKLHSQARIAKCHVNKKTSGGAGTHTVHTGAHGHTDHTDEPHKHPNPTTHPHDHATAETAADSTAAGPEPTAPRGRLRTVKRHRGEPGHTGCRVCRVNVHKGHTGHTDTRITQKNLTPVERYFMEHDLEGRGHAWPRSQWEWLGRPILQHWST